MCFICFDAEDHMLDKCVLIMLPSQNKDILLSLLLLPFKSPTALYKMSIISISNLIKHLDTTFRKGDDNTTVVVG